MSELQKRSQRLDTEMLILVPILSLALWANIANLWSSAGISNASGALIGLQRTLTVLFYVLLIVLLLVRKRSRMSTPSWRATCAAYAGTFCPFLLVLNRPDVESEGLTAISIVVITIGLSFSVYSLARLGRSFGVVPRARELVRSGPYRFVRHPLYVGEIVTFAGAVLGVLTLYSASLLLALVALQAYRAAQEEKVLQEAFPEYTSYMEQAGRFVPRLVKSASL